MTEREVSSERVSALPLVDGLEVVAWDVAPKGLPAEPTKSHSFVAEIEKQGGSITPLVTLSQASSVIAGLKARVAELEKALTKIDDIRNSIIGFQKVGWSDHVYPLVAALEEAGFSGKGYDVMRAEIRTMLAAEARISSLEEENKRLREALEPFAAVADHDIGDDETDDDIFWPISNARYSMSGRLRVGHLRASRQALEEHNG